MREHKAALVSIVLLAPWARGAGTFQDVPKKHWAYQAIQGLQDTGLIRGGVTGKFDGNKAFTRYEMAVVLARYVEKLKEAKHSVQGAVEKTYPLIRKLATEFSQELDLLGVKHQDMLARVTSLESRADASQQEMKELRAMVEENRRAILSMQGIEDPRRPAPMPVPGTPRPAAAQPAPPQTAVPAGYLPPPAPIFAPPGLQAQAQESWGGGRAAASTDPGIFSGAGEAGPLAVPDALRLQSLRLRARSMLAGDPRGARPSAASRLPPLPGGFPAPDARAGTLPPAAYQAPEAGPGFDPAGPTGAVAPGAGSGESPDLLAAIEELRNGQLAASDAERIGREVETMMAQGRARRSGTSMVYPLTERLFGPAGFGPPAGE